MAETETLESPVAETETLEESVLKIRLLVDKEKNKVVLAEVDKDFVDVLFSFTAFPMGTIVRLLEKYQQNQESKAITIGCFNKLYESVRNMDTDDFITEACKHTLLNTRSVKDMQCRELKINIDDNEVLEYYMCSETTVSSTVYSHAYSNFCSSRCSCGSLTDVMFTETAKKSELFIGYHNFFIVTDNMEVRPASVSTMFKTIRELGYADADKLQEILVDANHEKVLALLECLFSSDTPLTDVFLRNRNSYVMTRTDNMSNLAMQEGGSQASNKLFSLTLFVRTHDRKVIYAESRSDFVDLLFTFLAISLDSVGKLSETDIAIGCIGNFCKSIRGLSKETNPKKTQPHMLHWHYSIQKPLLGFCYTDDCGNTKLTKFYEHYRLKPIYPNGIVSEIHNSGGFVKQGRTYIISDDLTITPVTPSTFSMVKKLEAELNGIEEHAIEISRAEAIRLLLASLMTSNPLTTALGCLINSEEA